jgi:GxxExxY protein
MAGITSTKGYQFGTLSSAVIAACIDVQRELGRHCMEVDYQRALELALKACGLDYDREVEIPIIYQGVTVTRRRVDFVISCGEEELLLETKAASTIRPEDVEQCLLYLQQGGYHLCLLINFGVKPLGVRRFVDSAEARSWVPNRGEP